MFSHPARFIALGAGAGLPWFAPGTWGTLLGWALFNVFDPYLSDALWALVIALVFALGAWAGDVTGRHLNDPDSSHIVIDEVVAFWLVLWLLPTSGGNPLLWQAVAFGVFRAFDIAKPPPIRALDARYKHGVGVMLDDVMAAFYTALVLAVIVACWRAFGG